MKHLIEIINEKLDDENLKTITNYLKNDVIDLDINFNILFNKIKKAVKQIALTRDDIKMFFNDHHINKNNSNQKIDKKLPEEEKEKIRKQLQGTFNRKDIGWQITNIFIDNEQVDQFCEIIKNNGLITFDELKNRHSLFDDICEDFQKSAKDIFNIDDVKSHNSNVGKGEILLRFILKVDGENNKNNKEKYNYNFTYNESGDISLSGNEDTDIDTVISIENNNNDNDKKINIEVKGGDSLQTSGSIGRSLHSMNSTSQYFLDKLNFDIKYSGKSYRQDPEKIGEQFLASTHAGEALEKLLNTENKDGEIINDIELIIDTLVDSYAYQYKVDKNINDIKKIIKDYNTNFKIITVVDNKIKITKSLTEMIGLIQLYMYSISDNFNYLLVINQKTGKYSLVKIEDNYLNIIEQIEFYPPEGGKNVTEARRLASRVFPKEKNNK